MQIEHESRVHALSLALSALLAGGGSGGIRTQTGSSPTLKFPYQARATPQISPNSLFVQPERCEFQMDPYRTTYSYLLTICRLLNEACAARAEVEIEGTHSALRKNC
jgi:hypothetical protein